MFRRKIYILLGVVSLSLGVLIYILFRENSYIGIAFSRLSIIQAIRRMLEGFSCDFLEFYFPDFLWGFSLSCGFLAIYLPKRNGCIICTGIAFLCGCVWEWMQHKEIVSGTGDINDVLMYLLACITCTIINIRSERYEKN